MACLIFDNNGYRFTSTESSSSMVKYVENALKTLVFIKFFYEFLFPMDGDTNRRQSFDSISICVTGSWFHRQGGNRVYFSLGQTCEVGLGERNIRRWWWVGTLVVESNSIFVFIARKTRLVRCLGRSSRRRHRNCFRAKGFSCLFVFVSCHQNEMQASFYRGSW